MKKHFYFLSLILLCAFVGCSDDDSQASIEIGDGQQTVQTVYADDEVGTSAIKFKTTAAWTSGVYASGTKASSSTPDWVRITPESGNAAGEYSMSISFDVNTTGKKRSATIAIKCNGEESYIKVAQDGITKDGLIPGDDSSSKDIFQSITDVAFAAYCKKFDTNKNGKLSVDEAKEVKVIDITASNISDLAGIEYFVNLETLICPDNHIIALDLSRNDKLKILNCNSNSLVSLDITKNKLLDSLSCANNVIKSLDLSNNHALVKLECQNTELSSLDITANTQLKFVDCSENNIDKLNTSANIVLAELICRSNSLKSLDLSKNEYLVALTISNNSIDALNVSNSAKLEKLYCSSTNIASIDLSKNTKLKELECKLNSITSLDVSKSPELKSLDCENNPIETLNISANQALEYLNCYTSTDLTVNVWAAFDTASPKNSIADISYNETKTTFSK